MDIPAGLYLAGQGSVQIRLSGSLKIAGGLGAVKEQSTVEIAFFQIIVGLQIKIEFTLSPWPAYRAG